MNFIDAIAHHLIEIDFNAPPSIQIANVPFIIPNTLHHMHSFSIREPMRNVSFSRSNKFAIARYFNIFLLFLSHWALGLHFFPFRFFITASGWIHSQHRLSRIRDYTKRTIFQLQGTAAGLLCRRSDEMSSTDSKIFNFLNCTFGHVKHVFFFSPIFSIKGMALVSILRHNLLILVSQRNGIQPGVSCVRLVDERGLSICRAIVSQQWRIVSGWQR